MALSKIDEILANASAKDRKTWGHWLEDPDNTHAALAVVFGVDEASVRRWRKRHEMEQKSPKILLWDIESSPIIGYTWGMWDQNVIEVIQDWKLLTVSYTWYGSGEYQAVQLCDLKGYKPGKLDDKGLSQCARDLLNEADYSIAHNGDAFDVKKVNAKFAEHNIFPPSPHTQIDTLKVARSNMKMTSNKLDYLGERLGLGRKMKHSGFETWKGCMAGDQESWEEMRKYAIQDVVLLESVFEKLRPWVKGLQYGLFTNEQVCATCGSSGLTQDGQFKTLLTSLPAYRCSSCGSFSRQLTGR